MIPKIWCFIFGHKFYDMHYPTNFYSLMMERKPTNECQRCYAKKEK